MAPTIIVGVNQSYVGKLPKDASDSQWSRFNRSFETEAVDVAALASFIQQGYSITAHHHTNRERDNFQSSQILGLDFDTQDEKSRIDVLLSDPFIGQHAAIAHTTSSHRPDRPRARVLFILDQKVKDAEQYTAYARALVNHFGHSDQTCTDPCRLWFGSKDCELVTQPDSVLPVAVLDQMIQYQQDAQEAADKALDIDSSIDPDEALDAAIQRTEFGQRNSVGFWLACRLRDAGLTEAEAAPTMASFQVSVESLGDHPYTEREAQASLKSAYSRRPRGTSEQQLEKDVSLFEWFAWFDRQGLVNGGIHYSLQAVFEVSAMMRQAHRTQDINLAVRDFSAPKSTAQRHLQAMVDDSLLTYLLNIRWSRV